MPDPEEFDQINKINDWSAGGHPAGGSLAGGQSAGGSPAGGLSDCGIGWPPTGGPSTGGWPGVAELADLDQWSVRLRDDLYKSIRLAGAHLVAGGDPAKLLSGLLANKFTSADIMGPNVCTRINHTLGMLNVAIIEMALQAMAMHRSAQGRPIDLGNLASLFQAKE